jgi:hypothetical protein
MKQPIEIKMSGKIGKLIRDTDCRIVNLDEGGTIYIRNTYLEPYGYVEGSRITITISHCKSLEVHFPPISPNETS